MDLFVAMMVGGPVRSVAIGTGALALVGWLLGWPVVAAIVGAGLVGALVDTRWWPWIWRPW